MEQPSKLTIRTICEYESYIKFCPHFKELSRNQQRWFRLFVVAYLMDMIKSYIYFNRDIDMKLYDKLIKAYTPSQSLLKEDKKIRYKYYLEYEYYRQLPHDMRSKTKEPNCKRFPSKFLMEEIPFIEKYIKIRDDLIRTRNQHKLLCQQILDKHDFF